MDIQTKEEPVVVQLDLFNSYDIHIETLDYGYVVTIGWKRFSVENVEDLISRLSAYLRDPSYVIDLWNKYKQLPG